MLSYLYTLVTKVLGGMGVEAYGRVTNLNMLQLASHISWNSSGESFFKSWTAEHLCEFPESSDTNIKFQTCWVTYIPLLLKYLGVWVASGTVVQPVWICSNCHHIFLLRFTQCEKSIFREHLINPRCIGVVELWGTFYWDARHVACARKPSMEGALKNLDK